MSFELKNIGIIGEGRMGSSLFQSFLGFPLKLNWLCSSAEGRMEAVRFSDKKLRILTRTGAMTQEEATEKASMITISEVQDILAGCDLIIEAIPEDLELKKKLFQELDRMVDPYCLFTSNSSSFLPSRLCPSDQRKEKFAGMHFFFPVNLKSTVELVRSPHTSPETLHQLDHFLNCLDKKPFHQTEENAFVLNRLLLDFQAEAYHILQEGKMTMTEIDELVKTRFFPVGVFDFFDHVGIDVMLGAIATYAERAANPAYYAPLLNALQQLEAQGRLGLKTKHGFYIHCRSVGDITRATSQVPPSGEYLRCVEERLLTRFMDAAGKFMDEGIDPEILADAVMDYLGVDKNPFRTLISNC